VWLWLQPLIRSEIQYQQRRIVEVCSRFITICLNQGGKLMKKDFVDWEAMKLKPFKKDVFQRNIRVFKKSTIKQWEEINKKEKRKKLGDDVQS
tara:strand:+ start:544 stop:822 length:279 start_codon:yes stop_codon:yes gene_type:complete